MKGIVTILGSATALTTLLADGADSINSDDAAQGEGVPQVIVDLNDQDPIDSMSATELDEFRIRVFSVAKRAYTEGSEVGSTEVSDQVRTALDGYSGTVGSENLAKIRFENASRYKEHHGGNERVVVEQIYQVFKKF